MRPNALIGIVFALVAQSLASSRAPRPLKRIDHPSLISRDVHSAPHSHERRSLSARHPVRLTIRAFDDTYYLHLVPNRHLLHPRARINYYSADGLIQRTEPLTQRDAGIRVYEGIVVKREATDRRWIEDVAGGVLRRRGMEEEELGWARITIREDDEETYEGAFAVKGVGVHHIKTTSSYLLHRHPLDPHPDANAKNDHLVIFRDADFHSEDAITPLLQTCSHDDLEYNTDPHLNPILRPSTYHEQTPWYDPRLDSLSPANLVDLDARFIPSTLSKRQNNDISGGGSITTNYVNSIGSHAGCPSSQNVVYLGVAADCRFVQFYGGTANATTQILNDFNSATALYKSTFNVSLGIVELAVMDPTCPSNTTATTSSTPWNVDCIDSVTLNDRLSLFSQWRGAKGADDAGLWHLMSGCPTGQEVGVAWLGQLCNTQASGDPGSIVSGTAVTTATQTEWQVISHEIGHNFGAIHDCASGCTLSDQCCPSSTTQCSDSSVFVMDPVSYVGENTFSACSVGNICSAMQAMNTTCLKPADSTIATITLEQCGNGIVEEGEDCDPGKNVNSPCCNSATCKFISGALCDPLSSECCTNSCQFAASTQVCRPARDALCDIAEMCTGTTSACPADKTQPDGMKCGTDLACASGQCTSPSLQCKTVGASMNLTAACPQPDDKSCQVSCQDPTTSNSCIVLQASLINGSPCGYGGKCENTVCKTGSLGSTISGWYRQNLQISIPVTIAAVLVVLSLLWRIIAGIRASKRRRAQAAAYAGRGTPGRGGMVKLSSWDASHSAVPPGQEADNTYPPPPGAPMQNLSYNNAYPPSGTDYVYTPPGTVYPPSHLQGGEPQDYYAAESTNAPPGDGGFEAQNPFEQQKGSQQWDDGRGGRGYAR